MVAVSREQRNAAAVWDGIAMNSEMASPTKHATGDKIQDKVLM